MKNLVLILPVLVLAYVSAQGMWSVVNTNLKVS